METTNLKAIYFDGNSYILFPSFANFPKDELTIELWVKNESKDNVLFEFVDNDLEDYKVNLRFSFQNDNLMVTLFDSTITTTMALTNNWHHIAFVYKSFSMEDPIQIYIDGTSVPFDKTIDDFSTYKFSGKGDIYVGRKENDNKFIGYVRNLRIWNSHRTDLEIRQKMSVTLMDFDAYLVGLWYFSSMNEIESKLGVRLPQSFANQERDLDEVNLHTGAL